MFSRTVIRSLVIPLHAPLRCKAFSTVVAKAAPVSESNIVVPSSASNVAKNPDLDEFGRIYATGRRKTSVARVWLKEGCGQFVVNDEPLVSYFQSLQRTQILEPFIVSNSAGIYDVWCTVKGGGISGQAGAIRLGVSRALQKFDLLLRSPLKKAGMLTRDSRRVERKKPGQHKARKQYQWVKR